MKHLTAVPEGWYVKNRIGEIIIADNVQLMRLENRGGQGYFGLVQYFIKIDNITTPIPKTFFETFIHSNYPIHFYSEYLYLNDKFQTYKVYEDNAEGIYSNAEEII